MAKPRPTPFLLSLVVPMYNEEEVVDLFFERVFKTLDRSDFRLEIICIDDGSADSTIEKLRDWCARDARIKAITLSRNFGKEAALTAGLHHATGDAVIPIDVDLQDPPEVILDMIEKWRDGFDMVLAVRADRASDTPLKRLTAEWFYKIIGRLGEVKIPANAGDFRLLDRRVVDALETLGERNRFNKGLFAWLGFKQTTVEYVRPGREAGTSKWKYLRLWNFALEGIFSFSTAPLKVWSYFGFALAAAAIAYAVFLIGHTLIMGVDVPGYASLAVMVLFLSGMNFIGLGVLGEYMGLTFIETKRRPLYLIDEVITGEKAAKIDAETAVAKALKL